MRRKIYLLNVFISLALLFASLKEGISDYKEGKMKKVALSCILLLFFLLLTIPCFAQKTGFTKEDRERLVRVEVTLKVFMEQVDKRFEQVDKRFEQMMTFLWMLVAIFTTLTGVVIGFAYWDRKTIIRKARDEAIEVIEKEGRLRDLIRALRELASEDKKLANILRSFDLL